MFNICIASETARQPARRHEKAGMHGIDGMGTNHVFGRVESVEGVDNVANVEVLPVANTNTQLWNGEWVMGNGEWETGNGEVLHF